MRQIGWMDSTGSDDDDLPCWSIIPFSGREGREMPASHGVMTSKRQERAVALLRASMRGAMDAASDYAADRDPRTRAPAELSRAAALAWDDAYRREWSELALADVVLG